MLLHLSSNKKKDNVLLCDIKALIEDMLCKTFSVVNFSTALNI